ncbi:MAG TPA: hypothetical protein VFE24_03735 [Pirellulales bacterium]|jgi:hypothetical protein|nr:hypothetical protein [Pirellulales bacterium]
MVPLGTRHPLPVRSVGELLIDARNLHREGRFILAAMTARAALDCYLRQLHAQHNLPRPKRDCIGEFAESLQQARIINGPAGKLIYKLAKIGGRAVHNQPIDAEEISLLVEGVALLIEGGAQ